MLCIQPIEYMFGAVSSFTPTGKSGTGCDFILFLKLLNGGWFFFSFFFSVWGGAYPKLKEDLLGGARLPCSPWARWCGMRSAV